MLGWASAIEQIGVDLCPTSNQAPKQPLAGAAWLALNDPKRQKNHYYQTRDASEQRVKDERSLEFPRTQVSPLAGVRKKYSEPT